MAKRPVTVTTDANGFTVVQQGDEGALIPAPGTKGERYEGIEPVRSRMNTGKSISVNPNAHDVRCSKFGM
ncbi:hypothetical protein IVB15_26490 [Bradyrhizobium sp. 182]|uniref:hypothetical protein n=1 Tax=Bradyrhizobium sp. 182 TaxID=2782651 RepID=UPI001FFB5D40|nr:hypothetical protein [Bradyrhizobium sp. 182]MCK1531159.1 hypothetical protein [Bradyrhizobium sp. 182]